MTPEKLYSFKVFAQMVSWAKEAAPREACGLVLGCATSRVAEEALLLRNVHPHPSQAFALDPMEHLAAVRRSEAHGRVVCGLFHSHPQGGVELSREDRQGALWEGRPRFPQLDLLVVGLNDPEGPQVGIWGFCPQRGDFFQRDKSPGHPFGSRTAGGAVSPVV